MPTGLLDILSAAGIATGVARSMVVYTLVSAAHILGIALLLGPILVVDLALVGFARPLGAAGPRLERVAMTGAALSIATGLLLMTARPHEYAANPAFLAKLAVIGLALLNAVAFVWARRRGPAPPAWLTKACAALSIAAWLTVLGLGRLIAFV